MKSTSSDLLVAHHGRALAGYALVLTRRGSRLARLYSLAIAAAWMGRSLASRLLAEAEARAALNGAERLRLEVRTDNLPAIRLYEARGYKLFGRKDDYYADGAAALQYELGLPGASVAAETSSSRLGQAA